MAAFCEWVSMNCVKATKHLQGGNLLFTFKPPGIPRVFSTRGNEESPPTSVKNLLNPAPHLEEFPPPQQTPLPHQIFIHFPAKDFGVIIQQNIIFSCSHFSYTIFVLISYSFDTQVMVILILIDVQYLQILFLALKKF